MRALQMFGVVGAVWVLGCAPGRLDSGEPAVIVVPEGPACGDGACAGGETCASCAADCGACSATCGDGLCSPDETCQSCPADCGACAATCGDGLCGDGETCGDCPQDCGACPPVCGDDACDDSETCGDCPQDCGACSPVCGDDACDDSETCGDCPQDCGACPPVCGDGVCEGAEACEACPGDCGRCPPECGDGVCEGAETCDACPQDCGACGWPEALARSEEALLVMVNAQRAEGAVCGGLQMPPVDALTMNAELRDAARLHSQDMGENAYFDHTGLNGSSFSQRARTAGYTASPGGENIAAGNGPAEATFRQWLNSPGHCENMMRGRFNEIGVGHANVPGSPYRDYWTQVFGSR